jgi:hypothetical protein
VTGAFYLVIPSGSPAPQNAEASRADRLRPAVPPNGTHRSHPHEERALSAAASRRHTKPTFRIRAFALPGTRGVATEGTAVLNKLPRANSNPAKSNPAEANATRANATQTKGGRAATVRKYARAPLTLVGAGLAVAGVVAASAGTASAAATTHPAGPTSLAGQHEQPPSLATTTQVNWAAILGQKTAHQTSTSRAHPAPHAVARHRKPTAERLMPGGTSGTQAWMPISAAQLANARTIVHQAVAKGMGLRSAVIAVATAMQESQLVNVGYGTSDSLGLFQQQPDMGWGTAHQVMNPAYAADAFLAALRAHQAADPAWNGQPLWATAQAVQKSAFPFAYAKWETQAAHLVGQIAR